MFYYKDNYNNLIESTRQLASDILTPLTKEEFEAALALLKEEA